MFCPANAFDKNSEAIRDGLEASNIEKIFLLDKNASEIVDHEKLEIFKREDLPLPWNSHFSDMYPVLILKWRGCNLHQFNLKSVYVSIDLDVLTGGLVECDWRGNSNGLTVKEVSQTLDQLSEVTKIVAGDISGLAYSHEPTLRVIVTLYQALKEAIEKSMH